MAASGGQSRVVTEPQRDQGAKPLVGVWGQRPHKPKFDGCRRVMLQIFFLFRPKNPAFYKKAAFLTEI
jgi:hypothetical protein